MYKIQIMMKIMVMMIVQDERIKENRALGALRLAVQYNTDTRCKMMYRLKFMIAARYYPSP